MKTLLIIILKLYFLHVNFADIAFYTNKLYVIRTHKQFRIKILAKNYNLLNKTK